jgi:hypothetical protein
MIDAMRLYRLPAGEPKMNWGEFLYNWNCYHSVLPLSVVPEHHSAKKATTLFWIRPWNDAKWHYLLECSHSSNPGQSPAIIWTWQLDVWVQRLLIADNLITGCQEFTYWSSLVLMGFSAFPGWSARRGAVLSRGSICQILIENLPSKRSHMISVPA